MVYITQKAGQFPPGNRGIDDAAVRFRTAENQGVVCLLQLALGVQFVQFGVDMGVFGKQNNAEGIPIQPCDGVKSGFLCLLIFR